MKKITSIIIDDEPIARRILEDYIKPDERLSLLGTYKNAREAMPAMAEHRPELVFLDINMPGLSGFQFLKTMTDPPSVIFTTAYREFALQGFDANAIDYLLKPISPERFLLSIEKAYRLLRLLSSKSEPVPDAAEEDYFFVKSDGMLIKIFYKDVLFVEALKEYIKIVTRERQVVTYHTISGFEEKMPAGMFYRIHRSFLVNINAIDAIEGAVVKVGHHDLPLSREEKEAFINQITQGKMISKGKSG